MICPKEDMEMTKKIIALLLAIVMAVSLILPYIGL